jgi:uncharacterized membrane protein YoaK (UPF0700 family)
MDDRHPELMRDLLLVALTIASGAVDAISWLTFDKVFSAFMTGNMVILGFVVAGAAGPPLLRTAMSLGGFAVGAALGGRSVRPGSSDATWSRRVTVVLSLAVLIEAVFLALWLGVDARPSSTSANWLIALLALAMGLQTAAVFSLGVRAVFTTAATATWAALMGDLANWSESGQERLRFASVVAALFAGAVAGGLLVIHAPRWAPVLPLVMTAVVVAVAELSFAQRPAARLAQPHA